MNGIYTGDCLEIMKQFPTASIDLICTDLPFGVTKHKNDKIIPYHLLWNEYKRIIKNRGTIALFAQGKFYVNLVHSNIKMFRYDIVWNKKLVTGFLNAKRMPLRVHEQIAIFYKQPGTYNPQFTEGIPLHSKGTGYLDKKHRNQNYGDTNNPTDKRKGTTQKHPTSIITFQKPHPSIAVHATEKSLECIEWVVKTYSNEGDIVLDTCAGSGTLAEACINTNRRFIVIEKDVLLLPIIVRKVETAYKRKGIELKL